MAAKGERTLWIRLRSNTPPHEWLVHKELRSRMVADATARGTNLTDLANLILCNYFNVPYVANLRKSSPRVEQDILNFGVPPELDRVIRTQAALASRDPLDLARLVLCAHYGLKVPPKVKHQRRRRAAVPSAT